MEGGSRHLQLNQRRSQPVSRLYRAVGLAVATLWSIGCSSPLEPVACPQTSQWGTVGCAQVIVMVEEPETTSPGRRILNVTARSLDGANISHAGDPKFGTFRTLIDLGPFPQFSTTEPVSAWIVASIVDPLSDTPFLASDSVLTTLRGGVRPLE